MPGLRALSARAVTSCGALVAVVSFATPVVGQLPVVGPQGREEPRDCELIRNNFVFSRLLGEGNTNSYVSGPMEVRCAGGVRIQADSAVIYESSGYSQLFGHVMFEDPDKRLTSDRANYFARDRRLIALGGGRIVDKKRNTVLTGDTVIYARANEFRRQDNLTVRGGNPHAVLFPPEREAPAPDSVAMPTDSSAAVSDSLAPSRGPVAVATDSASGRRGNAAAAVDSADVIPDTVATTPDSAAVVPDSVAASPDSAVAVVDSAAVPGVGGLPTDPLAAQPDASLTRSGEPGGSRPGSRLSRPSPYEVDANHFSLVGDAIFRALGDVEIRRDSLEAFGDTLRYDQDSGDLALGGNARIEEDTYELTGKTVYLGEAPTGAQEVRAVGDAVLLGDQVDLTAPEIRIYLVESALERLVAVRNAAPPSAAAAEGGRGRAAPVPAPTQPVAPAAEDDDEPPPQPRAITEEFLLTGDSIEVNSAGEVLENVIAVGAARGESLARDSLNTEDTPEVARKDWMEGQTITAFFSPLPSLGRSAVVGDSLAAGAESGDGQARVTLDRLVAGGGARSLYRMTPTDTLQDAGPGRLALHYVTGQEITIRLRSGEVESMEVTGQTRGYHLEPQVTPSQVPPVLPDSAGVNDSIPAPAVIPVDTAAAVPPDPTPPDTIEGGASRVPRRHDEGTLAPLNRREPRPPALGPPEGRWARREDTA